MSTRVSLAPKEYVMLPSNTADSSELDQRSNWSQGRNQNLLMVESRVFIGLELAIKCVNFQSICVCLYYILTR